MRSRSKSLVAMVIVVLLGAGACDGGSGAGSSTSAKAKSGYGDCDKNPNTCNGGKTKPGGDYTFALDTSFSTWNVYTDERAAPAMAGLLPKVFSAQPDGTIKLNADLMLSAEVTNQSPETIVYKIKTEAVWNDGTPISADDFLLAWKLTSGNPANCTKCKPAGTAGYGLIKSVVASDNAKTVTVTFQDGKVYPDWKGLFSTDGLYPAHLATKQGFDLAKPDGVNSANDWFSATVPSWSGGPFIIDAFNNGQSVVEKKNDQWYGDTTSGLDKLTFTFMSDPAALAPALRGKEITGVNPEATADLVQQLGQIPGVISRLGHGYSWQHLDTNVANRYLADPVLRRAIFTAVNVKSIIGRTYGEFDKTARPLGSHNYVPGDTRYKDVVSDTGQGTGDTDKAKKLLTDAGYKITSGKLSTKLGEAVPQLRLRVAKGDQFAATAAGLVQSSLKDLGLELVVQETDTLTRMLSAGDFDLVIFSSDGSPLAQGLAQQQWASGNLKNYGKYSNLQVDKLITAAVSDFSDKAGEDPLNKADELMTKDAYVLPLVQKPTLIATYDTWANVRENDTPWGPTYNVQAWAQKAL
jgi:peptide/nickel transport system substrate-binding protein